MMFTDEVRHTKREDLYTKYYYKYQGMRELGKGRSGGLGCKGRG